SGTALPRAGGGVALAIAGATGAARVGIATLDGVRSINAANRMAVIIRVAATGRRFQPKRLGCNLVCAIALCNKPGGKSASSDLCALTISPIKCRQNSQFAKWD